METATGAKQLHTPGPWYWAQNERAGGIYLATPDRGQLIVMDFVRQGMQAGQPRFARWEGLERGRMGGIMKPAEILRLEEHPDACLIAASPDLLAACELFADWDISCRSLDVPKDVADAITNAVAKAKGSA